VAKWRGLPVRGVAFVGRTMGSIRGEDGARWPNRCQKRWVVIVVIGGQSIPSWDRFLLLQEVKDALKCPALTFQRDRQTYTILSEIVVRYHLERHRSVSLLARIIQDILKSVHSVSLVSFLPVLVRAVRLLSSTALLAVMCLLAAILPSSVPRVAFTSQHTVNYQTDVSGRIPLRYRIVQLL